MVKKLRYYARFIVVCLLLNKMDVVKDLVKVKTSHALLMEEFVMFLTCPPPKELGEVCLALKQAFEDWVD